VKFKLFLLFIAIGLAASTGSPLYADSVIPVQNASFENLSSSSTTGCGTGCFYNSGPIPGWITTGNSGSFQPNNTYFNLPLPNGNVVGYTNGGTISQDLGVSLLPNSFYTLSVFVGSRLDSYKGPYSIALDAGGTPLASLTGFSSEILPAGSFTDEILTFSTGSTVAPGDLSIVLGNPGDPQGDFDNVSLAVRAVPEPNSLIMLIAGIGFAGLLFTRRRT
jgi:hypothetical protein